MFDWMHTTEVVVSEPVSQSPSGKPIEKPPVILKCRIEPSVRKITDNTGNEVVAGGYIMFPAGTRFATGSTVEWEGVKHKLIKCEPVHLASENHETHVEGWFK